MKRILIIIFSAFSVAVSAQSIELSNIATQVENGELNLDFDISASAMKIRCNGQVTLEFAIENGERRVVLPMVIFSGKARSKYEQRRRILSDKSSAELSHTFVDVGRRDTHELHYSFVVPTQEWMSRSELTVREYTHVCDGERLTYSGVLAQVGPREETMVVSAPEPIPVRLPFVLSRCRCRSLSGAAMSRFG